MRRHPVYSCAVLAGRAMPAGVVAAVPTTTRGWTAAAPGFDDTFLVAALMILVIMPLFFFLTKGRMDPPAFPRTGREFCHV